MNAERPSRQEKVSGFTYLENLQRRFASAQSEELPRVLTGAVLESPTTNESWENTGYNGEVVSTSGHSNFYHSVVITAFDAAARDPEVARQFLARLDEEPEETRARLHPNDTIEDSEGFRRPWPQQRASVILEPPLLKTVMTRLRNNPKKTDRNAVDAIVAWCEPKLPKLRSVREQEAREARYQQSRETYPALVAELTVESVDTLSPEQVRVLAAASQTFIEATGHDSSERQIAEAIRDRAEEIRREDRKYVYNADSFDNFWERLAEFTSLYCEQTTYQKKDFYNDWKDRYIQRQKERMAKELLERESLSADPESFLPEGVALMQVTASDPYLTYTADELPELYTQLQRFCGANGVEDASSFAKDLENQQMVAQLEVDRETNASPFFIPHDRFALRKIDDENYQLIGQMNTRESFLSLRDFSAFSGKECSFDCVEVSYVCAPPEELSVSEGENSAVMAIPIQSMMAHFGEYAQVSPDNQNRLIGDVVCSLRGENGNGGLVTENGGIAQVWLGTSLARESRVEYFPGDPNIFYAETVARRNRRVDLPRVTFRYFEAGGDDVMRLCGIFDAMGVVSSSDERRGSLRDKNIFYHSGWKMQV